jgi:hypothetical protein
VPDINRVSEFHVSFGAAAGPPHSGTSANPVDPTPDFRITHLYFTSDSAIRQEKHLRFACLVPCEVAAD